MAYDLDILSCLNLVCDLPGCIVCRPGKGALTGRMLPSIRPGRQEPIVELAPRAGPARLPLIPNIVHREPGLDAIGLVYVRRHKLLNRLEGVDLV